MSVIDPVEIFRVEAQELLEQIEQGLLDLSHMPGDQELVAAVFRALHTLKGSGAMYGFDALAAFTHHCETAFDRVRKGEVTATPDLVAAVLNAMDHMRALAEERPCDVSVGEALLAELGRVVAAAARLPSPVTVFAAAPCATWRIVFSLAPDVLINGVRPLPMLDELRALGACSVRALTDAIPPLEGLDPTQCHLGWEVMLTTDASQAAIEEVFMFVMDDMSLDIQDVTNEPAEGSAAVNPSPAEVEPSSDAAQDTGPDAPSVSAAGRETVGADVKAVRTDASVRVPAERLDELMDRVGELVIAQSRLKEIAGASPDMSLRSVAEEIEHLASGLRDSMMSVRMVPVAQLFSRFRRLIHDLARDTGKEIDLVTEGETTELDTTVIERLADPLIHLIRNAADHGLETPDERLAAGKPARGRIVLSARQAGAEVVITVKDDGRGVNRARVRAKAEEGGLLAPGAAISDQDLLQMIFQPGFSTAATITSLSGRGVGMDMVKRTIEGLRGGLELSSPPGQGSQVALRIPLTLAIVDGLLVRVGTGRYVIPLSAVEECLELTPEQDARSIGRSVLTIRDRLVPFLRLRALFRTKTPPDKYQKVVVVSTGGERVGLVVDQILGDHQTVIKPLSAFHTSVGTFSGATILGDGGVAMILDVSCLATEAAQASPAPLRTAS